MNAKTDTALVGIWDVLFPGTPPWEIAFSPHGQFSYCAKDFSRISIGSWRLSVSSSVFPSIGTHTLRFYPNGAATPPDEVWSPSEWKEDEVSFANGTLIERLDSRQTSATERVHVVGLLCGHLQDLDTRVAILESRVHPLLQQLDILLGQHGFQPQGLCLQLRVLYREFFAGVSPLESVAAQIGAGGITVLANRIQREKARRQHEIDVIEQILAHGSGSVAELLRP
jgi:hypothetical protein